MARQSRSRSKLALSSAVLLGLIASVVASAPAAALSTDLPIVLDIDQLSQFEDVAGSPITIIDDSTTDAERTIAAVGTDGSPAQIVVYSAEPSTDGPEDLLALVNASAPALDDVTPAPLDVANLVPQVVTASTPTTLTVAWKAPVGADRFALLVDGEPVAESLEPNFILTGLLPDQPYSLSLRSTHTVPPIEPPNPPAPTEACPEPALVHTTDLSGWDLSQTRSAGHSVLVPTGLRVFTDDASSQAKAAGYYPVTVPLINVSSASLNWTGSAARAGLQLVTDFNGDASPDGILVGESVYGEDFWLSNSAAPFVKVGAPSHAPGFGSANHGLLPEWITAFPDAQVLATGYSLGSGVLGDGVIESIIVGCTSYTFGLGEAPATDRPIDTSMELSIATRPEATPAARRGDPNGASLVGAPIRSTEFQYQTFIPYPRVADSSDIRDLAVETGCIAGYQAFERSQDRDVFDDNPLDLTFKGDDRPYTAPLPENEKNYRTMMSFDYDWNLAALTTDKDVGLTQIVRKDTGEVVDEDEASTSRMTFSKFVTSSNSVSLVFNHVANDPFCPSGAGIGAPELGSITYKARVTMFKSGLVLVEGYRATMPAHEGWVRWNGQSKWSNVVALKASRLACLLQQEVPILNVLSGCIEAVKGSVNRSTDRWVTASSAWDAGTLALTKSGRTYGWGGYRAGIIEPFAQGCIVLETVEIPLDSTGKTIRAKQIEVSDRHGTAILRSGEIVTWGWGANIGRDGDSLRAISVSPIQFKDFATYDQTTYAVAESGDLYTWGAKLFDFADYPYPNPLPSWETPHLAATGYDFVDIAITDGTVIALDEDGDLWGYGNNNVELLGDRDPVWTPTWVPIPSGGANFVDLDAVYNTAMALDDQGRAWMWGVPRVPVISGNDDGFTGPALVDTDTKFKTLTGGEALSLLATSGDAHVISPYSSSETFSETKLPSSEEELVFVGDGLAITEYGEMLSLDSDGWTNRGLPPTTTPKDPPRICISDS